MDSEEIEVRTEQTLVSDATEELRGFCRGRGDGLVNIFVPHATAALAVMEVGARSEADLANAIDELLPLDRPYAHSHGSAGHGRDHVLPCLLSPSVTIPCLEGKPALGTWQHLVVVDSNRDNPRRRLRFSFVPA